MKTQPRKRCICGKIAFLSLADAWAEVQKQREDYDADYKIYKCSEVQKDIYHLTTSSYLKSTQLLIGEKTKNGLLILKCLSGTKYMTTMMNKYYPSLIGFVLKGLHAPLREGYGSDEVFNSQIFVIARKDKHSNWLSPNPYVSYSISSQEHKFRELDVAKEVLHRSEYTRSDKKTQFACMDAVEQGLSKMWDFITSQDPGVVNVLVGLNGDEVIPAQVEKVKEVMEEIPLTTLEEIEREIKHRKFIILHDEGLAAWESIRKNCGEDKSISDLIEEFLISTYNNTK